MILMHELDDLDASKKFMTSLRDRLASYAEFLQQAEQSLIQQAGQPSEMESKHLHNWMSLQVASSHYRQKLKRVISPYQSYKSINERLSMLDLLHGCSRYIHIVVGFIGLVVFWFPVLSKKGGRLHRFSGKVFAACAIIVGITGLLGGTWGAIAPLNYLATTGRPATSEQSQQLAEFIRFFMAILVVLSSATLNGACLGLATVWAKTDHQKLKAAWVLIPLLLNFLTAALLTLSGVIHLSSPSMGLNLVSASEAGKYWLHVILGAVVFITTLPIGTSSCSRQPVNSAGSTSM